jgi:hypothetical protein
VNCVHPKRNRVYPQSIAFIWPNEQQLEFNMRKYILVAFAIFAALSVAGCAGKGKSPIGKGKAPVVQTRG